MTTLTANQARRKLRNIGKRRRTHKADGDQLAEDTRAVLAETRGIVPVTEAAKLVEIDRSTIYQVYRRPEVNDGEADRSAEEGPPAGEQAA